MAELKPCPFCGSDNIRQVCTSDFDGSYMVFSMRCDSCGTMIGWQKTRKQAIDAWNKRS